MPHFALPLNRTRNFIERADLKQDAPTVRITVESTSSQKTPEAEQIIQLRLLRSRSDPLLRHRSDVLQHSRKWTQASL